MQRRIISIFMLIVIGGCATVSQPPGPPPQSFAPEILDHCHVGMDDPQYWIEKYIHRDRLLMSPREIEKMNRKNIERGLLTDVFAVKLWEYKYIEADRPGEDNPEGEWNLERPTAFSPGVLGGYTLYTYLKDETERIKRRQRWDVDGKPVAQQVFDAMDDNLNLGALHEDNPVRYGITRQRTDVRYYPSDMLMAGKQWDNDFDILQVSSIRAMQPVAILHESRDRHWLFVVTAYCRGWVWRGHVMENCQPEAVRIFTHPQNFLVVTGHAVDVVEETGSTRTARQLYMGTQCPLLGQTAQYYVIGLPASDAAGALLHQEAYISRDADVSVGYLPMTPRTICLQAFKLLKMPYAWGGKGEHRDCSQLVMDVYATMGLVLPRNSSAQARVGSKRLQFGRRDPVAEKAIALDKLDQPALLQFPGHIMIYLGREGDHYYAIHDIWAYRVLEEPEKDRKMIIGKVVVSDLSLGEGSTRGSLLERITTINLLQP